MCKWELLKENLLIILVGGIVGGLSGIIIYLFLKLIPEMTISHMLDVVIQILVAVGTIGAVVVALYLANRKFDYKNALCFIQFTYKFNKIASGVDANNEYNSEESLQLEFSSLSIQNCTTLDVKLYRLVCYDDLDQEYILYIMDGKPRILSSYKVVPVTKYPIAKEFVLTAVALYTDFGKYEIRYPSYKTNYFKTLN